MSTPLSEIALDQKPLPNLLERLRDNELVMSILTRTGEVVMRWFLRPQEMIGSLGACPQWGCLRARQPKDRAGKLSAVAPQRKSHPMMVNTSPCVMVLTVALVSAFFAAAAWAQQLFIYPLRGQSEQQQQQDRFECHQWAVQQTGFDPTVGLAPPPPGATGSLAGGAVRGAAGGAAIGAIGGAIGGSAGRGAGIGAGTGAALGTLRRNSQIRDEQAQQRAHSQQAGQQLANFNRAVATCLSGRGYTVS
jgi:hypothetical protein